VRWAGILLLSPVLLVAGYQAGCAQHTGWENADRIEVAAGNAHRGPWRMNDSEFDYVDDPTVAMTNDGYVGVAWADQARQNIFSRCTRRRASRVSRCR
jgi:hypothetical protein